MKTMLSGNGVCSGIYSPAYNGDSAVGKKCIVAIMDDISNELESPVSDRGVTQIRRILTDAVIYNSYNSRLLDYDIFSAKFWRD